MNFIAGEFASYPGFITPVLLLILLGVLFALSCILIQYDRLLYGSVIIVIGVPFIWTGASIWVFALGIAAVAIALSAASKVHAEFRDAPSFRLGRLLSLGVPLFFTAVSLVISFFYFAQSTEESAVWAIFPKPAMSYMLEHFGGMLEKTTGVPNIDPDDSVHETMKKLVDKEIERQGIPQDQVGESERERLAVLQREGIEKEFNVSLPPTQRVGDVLYRVISTRFTELLGPYREYLPAVTAVMFFLAFKFFTWPIYILTLFLSFLLIKLLVFARILKKETKTIQVEKLVL